MKAERPNSNTAPTRRIEHVLEVIFRFLRNGPSVAEEQTANTSWCHRTKTAKKIRTARKPNTSAARAVTDTLRCAEGNPMPSDPEVRGELMRRCAQAYKDLVLEHLEGEGVRTVSASATFFLCIMASLAPIVKGTLISHAGVMSSVAFPRSWCSASGPAAHPECPAERRYRRQGLQ